MAMVTIEQAKELFHEWRKSRRHVREAAPGKIRRVALQIKESFGTGVALKELGLSSATFSEWSRKAGKPDRPRKKVGVRRVTQPTTDAGTSMGFIEVAPSMEKKEASGPGLTLEWLRGDGSSLRLSGPIVPIQIEKLTFQFLAADERRQA